MTVWTVLLVGAGAAVGAPLRFVTDTVAKRRLGSASPWGTFAVNVAGAFVLGAVTAGAGALGHSVQAAVGTGFCGALTTYSTFGYEIVSLTERGDRRTALVYVSISVVVGVLAAATGWALVRAAL